MITNWAGNVTFSTEVLHRPRSVAEVQQVVAGADRLRVLGTGHSFNRIADTAGQLMSLAELPRTADVDAAAGTVRVDGGMRYAELATALRGSGFALSNTASLPHISLAGACATGTHGSGLTNQVLSAAVRSLTLVTAGGDLVTFERGADEFPGVALSLGRLGVVVEMVLDVVPDFQVAQTVVEDPAEAVVAAELPSVLGAAYSVSVCTNWAEVPRTQVWLKESVGRPGAWEKSPQWGGRLADGQRHLIEGMPVEFTTEQLGLPGPWADRLPHFRADFMPSTGAELQSEYLLPLSHATEAWEALSEVRDRLAPVLQVCEVRAVAPDQLWLSPTANATCVAYHFTWVDDTSQVLAAVRLVEQQLAGLEARPHWGKLFTVPATRLADLYPGLEPFRRLVMDVDPAAKLGNDLVDAWLGLLTPGR